MKKLVSAAATALLVACGVEGPNDPATPDVPLEPGSVELEPTGPTLWTGLSKSGLRGPSSVRLVDAQGAVITQHEYVYENDVLVEMRWVGSTVAPTRYEYNERGLLARMVYGSPADELANGYEYIYDDSDHLIEMSGLGAVESVRYQWGEDGRLGHCESLPLDGNGYGMRINFGYSTTGLLDERTSQKWLGDHWSAPDAITYQHRSDGRVLSRTIRNPAGSFVTSYSYDSEGRVIAVQDNGQLSQIREYPADGTMHVRYVAGDPANETVAIHSFHATAPDWSNAPWEAEPRDP